MGIFQRESRVPHIRSIGSVVAIFTVCLSALAGAQARPQPNERQVPVGTSSISGTVELTDTGRGVAGAQVTINGQTICAGVSSQAPCEAMWLSRGVSTDEAGRFSFPRLPAGVFKISVSGLRNQFLATNYGQRRPFGEGQSILLTEGQKITLKVPVLRGAIITGTVRGPDGEPQQYAQVRALHYETSNGLKRLQTRANAQTDDRGVYRIFGLQPGDYIVAATPNSGDLQDRGQMKAEQDLVERAIASAPVRPPQSSGMPATIAVAVGPQSPPDYMTYLPTYAPSATTPADAAAVNVTGSDELTGVDIRVQLISSGTIKGVVSTSLEAGVTVQLSLLNDGSALDNSMMFTTQPRPDGTFVFNGVAPGGYTVLAETVPAQPQTPQPQRPVLTDTQKLWGRACVTVSASAVVSMAIDLQPSRSISGVVVFDTRQRPDIVQGRTVTARMAPSAQRPYSPNGEPKAVVGTDGRFTISGVPAGRYILELSGGDLKSAVIDGQDTLDYPLEFAGDRDVSGAVLTVSDRVGELEGTLTDAAAKPALDYMILVASTDSRFWIPGSRRVRMTGVSPNGQWEMGQLPPGTYQISVLCDPEPGAIYDPDFLRAIARTSIPVTIADGKITQNLRVK